MRPVAVLILVLGAVSALGFAIFSILDDSRPRGPAGTGIVGPALAAEPRETNLVDVAQPAPRPVPVQIEERAEVDTAAGIDPALAGFIEGTVVDPDRNPVPDAVISLVSQHPGAFSEAIRLMRKGEEAPARAHRTTTTDGYGIFRFDGLKPGDSWTLVVTHESYSRREWGPIRVPEKDGHITEILLEPGLGFFGRVTDAETGEPVPGAHLMVDSPTFAFVSSAVQSESRLETYADDDGSYSMNNVGGGAKTLVIEAPGYATQIHHNLKLVTDPSAAKIRNVRQGMPRTGGPKEINYELSKGTLLAGRVVGPDGTGIPGADVVVTNHDRRVGSKGSAFSGDNGEFLIEDIADGMYTVRATVDGWFGKPLPRIEAARTDVEIVMSRMGGVRGRVIDAATGRPVTNFTCKVRTMHPRARTWGSVIVKQDFRRKDGSFELQGLTERQYVVEAVGKGYASSFSEPFSVAQGVTTPDIVVRMTKGGTLTGLVLDAYTSEPIRGAKVTTNDNNFVDSEIMNLLGSMSPTALTKVTVTTDAEGRFEIPLVTPADYQLHIEVKGYTPLVLNDITVGEALTTDVGPQLLSKGAVVRGTVYGPDGREVSGAKVHLIPSDERGLMTLEGRTDANGQFVIENAKPGNYKLSAARPQGALDNPFSAIVDLRNSELEVTVLDGGDYEFELNMGKN